MTTATDWDVQDAETGEHPVVTDVTSAATDAPALSLDDMDALMQRNEQLGRENAKLRAAMGAWTPPQSSLRQQRDLSGGPARHDLPARTWARMSGARTWPQIPETALTAYGRAQAEYDSAHQQIQDWRDLAFWAEQEQRKIVSEISDDYWSRRSAMQHRYETEVARLHAEDDDATYAAYVKALPDYVRGNTTTVATERHTSVYGGHTYDDDNGFVPTGALERHDPPRREDEPEPEPDDRVQRMAEGRRRRDTLATRSSDDAVPAPQRRPWWRRRGEWLIAAGVVVAWAGAIATVVVLA